MRLPSIERDVERLQGEGKTAMIVAADGEALGVIAVADTVKPTSRAAVAELQRMGLQVVMLTGDNRAHRRGDRAPGRAWIACWPRCCRQAKPTRSRGCRPRARWWRWSATASTTRRRWRRPMWASRSAPAPTWRSQAADITLMRGDLRSVPQAIALSKRTMTTIKLEPVLGVHLQRDRHPDRGGRALPAHRLAAQPDHRRWGDDVQLCFRCLQ